MGVLPLCAQLRSKTPEMVRQELWELMLAHFAIRAPLHEDAVRTGVRSRKLVSDAGQTERAAVVEAMPML